MLAERHDDEGRGSGPSDWPKLPPTWNRLWAKPCRPPEAARATREASGWKTALPTPMTATETRIIG